MESISIGVIERSLTDIVKGLEKYIIGNNICRKDNQITWNNYQSGIIKKTYYPFEYQKIIDEKQYSILLNDLSAIQFFYDFTNDSKLISARLAIYPNPELTIPVTGINEFENLSFQDEVYDHMYSIMDIMSDLNEYDCLFPTNTSHLRFDYDSDAKSHSKSHFQVSSINNLRIDTNFILLPKVFLFFCRNLFQNDTLNLLNLESEEAHFTSFDDLKRNHWHMHYQKILRVQGSNS
ncbi:DUF2290 domain-containing protein [Acinetobacter pittii]|uniref:DUF2290 domain-containing protein n=1 Tax=Acinetobacter pittii TaxID=48296 RepID=UPI0021CD6A18|nr:DUF2290 domain-containing protein [Acinetobacter pittii]MCU4549722.1 DUF2290 domain-containing protein [Acinetobacter pittii]MDO7383960.1 DUF2290 domain-containing protein [Acinetobacter baumannii]